MTTIHNRFEYEGKKYTAEPLPFVRVGDVLLKVKSTDENGAATVEPSKASPPAEKVAIAAEEPVDPATQLAALKIEWGNHESAIKMARDEQQKTEADIAALLVSMGGKKGKSVSLGEKRYRATKPRDGGAPRLVEVPDYDDA